MKLFGTAIITVALAASQCVGQCNPQFEDCPPACYICGDGMQVGNPVSEVDISAIYPDATNMIPCQQLEEMGLTACLITVEQCSKIRGGSVDLTPCGCTPPTRGPLPNSCPSVGPTPNPTNAKASKAPKASKATLGLQTQIQAQQMKASGSSTYISPSALALATFVSLALISGATFY